MACCDKPDPRILEVNQRLFCASCKRYLDVQAAPEQEPIPQTPPPDIVQPEP